MNERETLRSYDQLNVDEKVLAILGEVMAPVPREYALYLAGINFEQLSATDRAKVDNIFLNSPSFGVEISHGAEETFRLHAQKHQEMSVSINMETVKRRISDALKEQLKNDPTLGNLDLDLDFGLDDDDEVTE